MNNYKLYEVKYIKGMMMYKFITKSLYDNIIQAENEFELSGLMIIGNEYVITIEKNY